MTGRHDPRGSVWHRWDPHIHSPGTVHEDRFGGDWEGYLTALENSDPPIRVLGITDYCLLDGYEAVSRQKQSGRLKNVDLIFPNVELRYDVGVPKGSAINVHLLVRPDDPDHVKRTRDFLSSLSLKIDGEEFCCERSSLIRLGLRHDPALKGNDKAALAAGVNQFKVNREELHEKLKMRWASENILTAVSVSSKDGTSALQSDASFTAIRQDIEKTANIILSSQEKQREFWLGRGAVTGAEFVNRYGGPKPCIHGDDAHDLAHVGKPDGDRYTWIKGDLVFDSLRQICYEPESRVAIGSAPPDGALPSQIMATVSLTNAPWFKDGSVPLNPGLVGIIGARGSGKTALADIIAAGSYALAGHASDRSFVSRAKEHLEDSTAYLEWEDGDESHWPVIEARGDECWEEPRTQYLSQQFVDILCSSEGVADKLLDEIKRVVFDAYEPASRMGATSFEELLDIRTTRARMSRLNNENAFRETIAQMLAEWQKKTGLKALKAKVDELSKNVEKDKEDRAKLIGKGGDDRVKLLDEVSRASEAMQLKVQQANRKLQSLLGLRDEVESVRKSGAPLRLRQLRAAHVEAALEETDWKAFELRYAEDVDDILGRHIKQAEEQIRALSGPKPGEPTFPPPGQQNPPLSFLEGEAALEKRTLSLLRAEAERLRALIGIDTRNAAIVKRLSEKISKDENSLSQLRREVESAELAPKRMAELDDTRQAVYAAIIESIVDEERQLADLYAPLREQLESAQGAMSKLSFSVRRRVDLAAWAERGEELFDLRVNGAFPGHGKLLEKARADLLPAWLHGDSREVAEAVQSFRRSHDDGMMTQAKANRKDQAAWRKWWGDLAAWLWGTDHISVAYSVQYDGGDVEQLSPGTRGIVLLLLYLAIDQQDERPLIIDQPEENLDPKSIHDELVEHFRRAKQRRQIIVVTHNANIVVNADADQVIVAQCGPHQSGRLPDITYYSGALENGVIRKRVCEILEGGEEAFRERAKRLRIRT